MRQSRSSSPTKFPQHLKSDPARCPMLLSPRRGSDRQRGDTKFLRLLYITLNHDVTFLHSVAHYPGLMGNPILRPSRERCLLIG